MVSGNEFSHVIKLGDIGAGVSHVHIAADEQQRAALTVRFDLQSLDRLDADIAISQNASGVSVKGRFRAELAQYCIATNDPVPVQLNEEITVRFVAAPKHGKDAEIELDTEELDSMFHDGQGVDIGEAVAQSMGLALDPYPRSPDAQAALREAGVVSEEEAQEKDGPFSALAALKGKLKQ